MGAAPVSFLWRSAPLRAGPVQLPIRLRSGSPRTGASADRCGIFPYVYPRRCHPTVRLAQGGAPGISAPAKLKRSRSLTVLPSPTRVRRFRDKCLVGFGDNTDSKSRASKGRSKISKGKSDGLQEKKCFQGNRFWETPTLRHSLRHRPHRPTLTHIDESVQLTRKK